MQCHASRGVSRGRTLGMRVACVALACVCFVASMWLQSAEARIRLSDSEMLAGVLVVAGWTERPRETITLDGKFTAASDRRHRFYFRIPYYPASCTVTLKTDTDERTAAVAVCAAAGAAGPRGSADCDTPCSPCGPCGPTGAQGPQGLQGVQGPPGPQ